MSHTTDFVIRVACLVVSAYFIGGLHFATIIARLKGVNIRDVGSGNPGTMNMLRNFGMSTGILTMILDALKGAIPAMVGYFLLAKHPLLATVSDWAPWWLGYYINSAGKLGSYIGGMAVIIGHIFPVLNKFKGGKGVASSIGVLLVANPIAALVAFTAAFTYLFFFKYGSVASFIFLYTSVISEIVLAVIFRDSIVTITLIVALCALITWAHRGNIIRLIKGQESDINLQKKMREKREGKLLGGKNNKIN